jgi:hypothetical protein
VQIAANAISQEPPLLPASSLQERILPKLDAKGLELVVKTKKEASKVIAPHGVGSVGELRDRQTINFRV